MIVHSPESPMPPPYDAYVAQRAAGIARELAPIVGGTDVQLCSRAVLASEVVVDEGGIVYGAVVDAPADGLKTALYAEGSDLYGRMVHSVGQAVEYAQRLLDGGNAVRFKDPRASSDAQDQGTIRAIEELAAPLGKYQGSLDDYGLVLMPHLHVAPDGRHTVGRVDLGPLGVYGYFGRELITKNSEGDDAWGGGDIALFREGDHQAQKAAAQMLDVPMTVAEKGSQAIRRYLAIARRVGCVSVDVLVGRTDRGEEIAAVVDISPRVNGFTAAEVKCIRELVGNPDSRVASGYVRLYYEAAEAPGVGTVFVDTPTLVIKAGVTEVKGASL